MARRAGGPAGERTRRGAAMSGTLTLGQVAGIEVGVHYTWLLIFALITFSLAVGYFPAAIPALQPLEYWLLGAASAILLFISVLIHELSHSLVAQRRGLPVNSITLFIFGGVSSIEEEASSPRDEFLISVVGPASSLILAGIFWLAAALATGGVASALLTYLATINLALGIFNLLPGFPLDGGRVLRAIVWAATSDERKATNWSATAGHVLAFLLIAFGFFQILAGNFLGGIWIAFIGWFLNGAADSSRQQVATREAFHGVRVEALMDPDPPTVDAAVTVKEVVEDHILGHGRRAVLVVDRDGSLVGIATLTDVRELPQPSWPQTTVGAIMTRAPLIGVDADEPVRRAADLMAERDVNQLVVSDGGQPVGMLSRGSLIRYLRYRDELGLRSVAVGKSESDDTRQRAA